MSALKLRVKRRSLLPFYNCSPLVAVAVGRAPSAAFALTNCALHLRRPLRVRALRMIKAMLLPPPLTMTMTMMLLLLMMIKSSRSHNFSTLCSGRRPAGGALA